jgi:uncharacterized protein YndB with AHSA1/START domain
MAIQAPATHKLVIRRKMPVPREDVYAAWTDPESMREWMCPGDVLSAEAKLDVRVGGSYRILMKGGKQEYDHTGTYQIVEPPSKLAFTWISKGTDNQQTLVTLEFLDHGKESELVLTHERFASENMMKRHHGGWAQIVEKLAGHLKK